MGVSAKLSDSKLVRARCAVGCMRLMCLELQTATSSCQKDYACCIVGLYVIRRNGANLMVIAGAVSLPLSQIIFTMPFMGQYQELFRATDLVAVGGWGEGMWRCRVRVRVCVHACALARAN